ncbi:MAG: PD-(D/E)XK nuclease family protein [Candidatus Brocadiaceae bacterium]|nr:PD-(D/E)XK nuclease family protein [Candidatus Brocadiaceae bacterium]
MKDSTAIGAATFADLEAAFVQCLGETAGRPPGTVWVLVPTNLLGLHLRRLAAHRLGGLAGVEFLTLQDAARRLALPALARRGARPLPAGAAELFLKRQLDAVPAGSYFHELSRFPNGASAVESAIRTLEECLWAPEALARAAAEGNHADDPGAPRRLQELARIWGALRDWKEGAGLFEEADLVPLAGRAPGAPPAWPGVLCIYGFYDLNPAQRLLVRRLAEVAEVRRLFVLWVECEGEPAPGYEYAAPTVSWLCDLLGVERVDCLPARGPQGNLRRLTEGLFQAHPPASDGPEPPAPDGSVRVLNCPGAEAEAAEVVREVLRAADAEGGPPPSVGVLLRGGEDVGRLLTEAFACAGVRHYQREGIALDETPAGRIAAALLDLAMGEAERADVVDFLSLVDVDWPAGLSPSAVDRVARQAGVVRGRVHWMERLRTRAADLAGRAGAGGDDAGGDDAGGDASGRESTLCTTAAGFLEALFQAIEPLRTVRTWAEAAGIMEGLTGRYAPSDDAGTGPVREVIRGMAGLDVAGVPADPGRVRAMLQRRLGRQRLRHGRFQHTPVAVAPIMDARGVSFDLVVIPALDEGNFPRSPSPQPLLTESDREALNEVAGRCGCGALPRQRRRPDEERCLFRIAAASARRALVLAHSRLDQGAGRMRMPSRFLLEACSAVVGAAVPASEVQEGRPSGLVHRVSRERRLHGGAEPAYAVDEVEYDAAVFEAPDGAGLRTGYLAAVNRHFARAVALEHGRWGRPLFGPCDGRLEAPDVRACLRETHGRFAGAVSPSRFETYARCPFEYFLRYVLGVEEVEAPPDELELPALERGSLLHEVLRGLYQERLQGRALGRLSDDDVAAAVEHALERMDDCGRVHAENHPLTWEAERARTVRRLRRMLRHERSAHAEATPVRFECDFGMGGEPGYTLSLGGGGDVAFRGRIDRIDALPDGAIAIVDYKTGKGAALKGRDLAGGTQLQLPIYLLAACRMMDVTDGSARYLLVDVPKDVPQFTRRELEERLEDFRRVVGGILQGIAAGDFCPLPAQSAGSHCERYCSFRAVCGAARGFLAQMKAADPAAQRLQDLRADH